MTTQNDPQIEIPKEIEARLNEWHRLYKLANNIHYILGISGVLASALAASNLDIKLCGYDYQPAPLLSALAATLIAAIGFIQPNRTYLKFVSAWRILDAASLRYRYGLIDINALFLVLEQAEHLIEIPEKESKGRS